ncbi:YybH family protein [Microvirga thermotolerans]|uniref:DUF4440 domain-containing protein n=1 Tax=Microvirga thermotolerans TaxID=2651334 RepID=A0A5P9JSX6_9HYPH|nr:nuclear transport factor 2 family protein [Microvirga thermotolerans]QFU15737.1 DUF4440 domain-containing protein [Microvirga thermotolerans]
MHGRPLPPQPEHAIRVRIAGWCSAVRLRDVEAIAAFYAPDVLAFDAVARLRFEGLEAYKRHWRECLAPDGAEMIFDVRDVAVAAGEDLAFAHFLNRCGRKLADGEERFAWLRVTAGYRRRAGQWLIVHEHVSAPFDLESGEALIDLVP